MKNMKYFVTGFLAASILASTQCSFAQNTYNTGSYTRPQLQGKVTLIPMGTVVSAVTTCDISSETLIVGDNVALTLGAPFYYKGNLIAPANSTVLGLVVEAQKAGHAERNGKIRIKFNELITPGGNRIPISAKLITPDGTGVLMGAATKDRAKNIAKDVVIGSAGGALSGLVFGSMAGGNAGRGTALGTALGAGLGLGKTIIDKGVEAVLPQGTQVNIMLDQPATVNY